MPDLFCFWLNHFIGFLFIFNNQLPVITHIMSLKDIQSEITTLESQLTGNMFQDMEVKDKIHNLKMKANGTRPMNSEIECVGCGS